MALTALATIVKHVQEEAASVWTIVHNMGTYPIVDVYIEDQGTIQKIIPSGVTYIDPLTCTVSFSVPRTGFATVI